MAGDWSMMQGRFRGNRPVREAQQINCTLHSELCTLHTPCFQIFPYSFVNDCKNKSLYYNVDVVIGMERACEHKRI